MTADFGIYIKTFRADYYLARALIASLEDHAPGVPIMMVPDDGYAEPTLWGLPVLHMEEPFFARLRGYLKKLWVFWGPYERFLYLDADQIALKSLTPLIDSALAREAPFMIVDENPSVLETFERGGEDAERNFRVAAGDPDLLARLDLPIDLRDFYPFASGDFVSSRNAFDLDEFKQLYEEIAALHREVGIGAPGTTREGPFSAEQGLINYLTYSTGIEIERIPTMFIWGGKSLADYRLAVDGPQDPRSHLFVHWGGCPRPSVLRRSVPDGELWQAYHRTFFDRHGSLVEHRKAWMENAVFGLKGRARSTASRLRGRS